MASPFDDPIEEGQDQEISKALYIKAQLQALNNQRVSLLESDRDKSEQYNTYLGRQNEESYQNWKQSASAVYGDIDESDYDWRGLFFDTGGAIPTDISKPARYRKPNHIEFTTESRYHGVDGFQGGTYTADGTFMVGGSNFYSPEEVQNFFSQEAPEIKVDDTRFESSQTERLSRLLQDDYGYSYVKSDIEAYQNAEELGDRTIGEVVKDAFDPDGENVFGRIVGTIGGGAIGAALATGAAGTLAGGPIGTLAGIIIGGIGGAIGAIGGDGLAIWGSNREERAIEEKLLRLEADDYTDPLEREQAEMDVADWYNEMNIERYRSQGWGADVADGFLESLPYMASFLGPGAIKGVLGAKGVRQVSKKLATILKADPKKPGFNEMLETGIVAEGLEELIESPFKITKEQSKNILETVRGQAKSPNSLPTSELYATAMKSQFESNVQNWIKSKPIRLGVTGAETLAVQQASIFNELKQEQLESVSVSDDGNIVFDDITLSDVALKEANAYLAVVVETVGFEYASKLIKSTGLQKTLQPVFENVVGSKPVRTLGRTGIRKGIENFNKSILGKSFQGKTEVMRTLLEKMQFGGVLEEASEEYIEMVASATLGLDKDQREAQDLTYAENLLDKTLFPVLHPKEASVILASVAIIPTGAAAFSTIRGDKLKEVREQELNIVKRLVEIQTSGNFSTAEELNEAFKETETLVKNIIRTDDISQFENQGIVGKIIGAGKKAQRLIGGKRENDFLVQQGFGFRDSLELARAVNARAEQIANRTGLNAKSEDVISQASSEIVSESVVARLAISAEGITEQEAIDALDKLRKDKSIFEFGVSQQTEAGEQGFAALGVQALPSGRKAVTVKYGITEAKRKELSSDPKIKALLESQGIITVTETVERANRKILNEKVEIKTDSFKELSDAIKAGENKEIIKSLKDTAVANLSAQLDLIFPSAAKGRPAQQAINETRLRVESIADSIVSELSTNPDLKISLAPSQVIQSLTEQEQEEVGRNTEDGIMVIQAANLDNEIILSNLSTFATPTEEDPESSRAFEGGRVVEEEGLELNLKAGRGTTRLNTLAQRSLNQIKKRAESVIEGEEFSETEKQQAGEVLSHLGGLSNFEGFVSLTQAAYGEQASNARSGSLRTIEFANDEELNLFNQGVLSMYSGAKLDSLRSNMVSQIGLGAVQQAEQDLALVKGKGKSAVQRFLETQPTVTPKPKDQRKKPFVSLKIKEAKEEAIKEVKQQVTSNVLFPEERQLASKVLTILERDYQDDSGVETKAKAQIKKLHNQYAGITYSGDNLNLDDDAKLIIDQYKDNPQEANRRIDESEDKVEESNSDFSYGSTYGDKFLSQDKISQILTRQRGKREAAAILQNWREEEWLEKSLETKESWEEFKASQPTSSSERLLVQIAIDNNLSYQQVKRFQRQNSGNHTYKHMYLNQEDGKLTLRPSNNIDLIQEIADSVELAADDPAFLEETNNTFKSILEKDRNDVTQEDLVQMFDLLEEWTGISSTALREIDAEFENQIINILFSIDPSKLSNKSATYLKNVIAENLGKTEIQFFDKDTSETVTKKLSDRSLGRAGTISELILKSTAVGKVRNAPVFTAITGSQKSASRGDSHFHQTLGPILDLLDLTEEQKVAVQSDFIQFLGGTVKEKTTKETHNFERSDVEEAVVSVFSESRNLGYLERLSGKKVYYHNMGRFGEKGSMPFVIQPFYGETKQELMQKAIEAQKFIEENFKSKDAKDLFTDPVALVESLPDGKLSEEQLASVHYAINDPRIVHKLHGDISIYMINEEKKAGKNSDQIKSVNFLNIVARTSQILTDGIAYSGSLNVIRVPEIGDQAFDGLAIITDEKMKDIAEDLAIDDIDSLKAHISNTRSGARNLVKVNWHNIKLLAEAAPEFKALQEYINNWNKNNPDNKIDAVVFESGAKYLPGAVDTNWRDNEDPNIIKYGAGDNLIVSQDLHHINDATHTGFIPSQRIAHFAALNPMFTATLPDGSQRTYTDSGLLAYNLRQEAAELRLKESKKTKKKTDASSLSSPELQRAAAAGENLDIDARYTSQLYTVALSKTKGELRHSGARSALQTIGQGLEQELSGYQLITDEEGNSLYVKVARINANVVGGRYATRTNNKGEKFKTKEEAIEFIKQNSRIFLDMFWVNEQGIPDFNHVLEHEIDQEGNSWVIPGEIVERTRIPSGAYTSHSFNRLMDPVTRLFPEANVAVPNDGIRIAMGEDLDGDKGFTLILHRGIVRSIENGKYDIIDGRLKVVNESGKDNLRFIFGAESNTGNAQIDIMTLENRALLLEHIAWIAPQSFPLYDVEGDIAKDAFDEAIDRTSDPILTQLRFGSLEGLGLASEINYIRQKVIGTVAVYNSMYSALSVGVNAPSIEIVESADPISFKSDDVVITLNDFSKINLQPYNTVKRILDMALNIALDDHKDPRLFFANLTPDNASLFGMMVMSNVTSNDIGRTPEDAKSSMAVRKVHDIIAFLKSDEVKIIHEANRIRKENKEAIKPESFVITQELLDSLGIEKIGMSFEELQSLAFRFFSMQKNMFSITALLNATKNIPSNPAEIKRLLDALNEYETKSGIFATIDSPLIKNGALAAKEYLIQLSDLPQVKLLAEQSSLTETQLVNATMENLSDVSQVIVLQSLYELDKGEGVVTSKFIEEQYAVLEKALGRPKGNKLLKRLVKEKDKYSLMDSLKRRDLSEKDLITYRESFNRLPANVQRALTVVAYHQYGMRTSLWTGNWITFISEELSKQINGKMNSAFNTLAESNLQGVFKELLPQSELLKLKDYGGEISQAVLTGSKPDTSRDITEEETIGTEEETDTKPEIQEVVEEKVEETPQEIERANIGSVVQTIQPMKNVSQFSTATLARNRKVDISEVPSIQIVSGKVAIDPKAIAKEFSENKTDDIVFQTSGQYADYKIRKIQLENEGVENPKETALKDMNYTSDRGDEQISYSMVTAKRLDNGSKFIKEAESFEQQGLSKEEIFERTGLYRWYSDGEWRYELDKNKFNITIVDIDEEDTLPYDGLRTVKLEDTVKYEELYSLYPELNNVVVTIKDKSDMNTRGGYLRMEDSLPGEIILSSELLDNYPEYIEVLIHEVQHAIQDIEGFSAGDNSNIHRAALRSTFIDSRKEDVESLTSEEQQRLKQLADSIAYSVYLSNPGEIEARIASIRFNYTPEQKAEETPWDTALNDLRMRGRAKDSETFDEYIEKTARGTGQQIETDDKSSKVFISVNHDLIADKILELSKSVHTNPNLSNKKSTPALIKKAFKRFGINIPAESPIHYETIEQAFEDQYRDSQMMQSRMPSEAPYFDQAVQNAANAIKSIPQDLSSLPGDTQAFIYVNKDKLGSNMTTAYQAIEKENYKEAIDHIFDLQKKDDVHYDLIDSLVEFDALKETADNIANDKAPSIFLRTTKKNKGQNEYQVNEYLMSSLADFELEQYGLSYKDLSGSPGQQYLAVEKIKESENFTLLGKVKKAIRISNGVPTKFQIKNNESEKQIKPSEVSYSAAVFDRITDMSGFLTNMNDDFGTTEMQNGLKYAARNSKELMRFGRAHKFQLLMDTGASTYEGLEGNRIKTTAEGKRLGAILRNALTYFTEHFDPENLNDDSWKDIPVYTQPGKPEGTITIGESFAMWQEYRDKSAPHLMDVSNPSEVFERTNGIFNAQYDKLKSISSYIGELWFAKRKNYVPHFYAMDESLKKQTDRKKEVAKQENGRKYDTYLAAYEENELIPETLDFAELIEKYATETALVSRNRLGVSAMAQVSDVDMMPMMLIEGVEKMGVLTPKAAHIMANKLQKAMKLIKPEFEFKTPATIDGFERLSRMTQEINPAELGYEVIDTKYESLKTVWVKKGTPRQLMDHIFADQREFSHPFIKKAFDSLVAMNHLAKQMSIGLSLFHPFALIESLIAIDGLQGLEKRGMFKKNLIFNPIRTIRSLRKELRQTIFNPEYNGEWIAAGLDFDTGKAPDIDYAMINNKVMELGKKMSKSPIGKYSLAGWSFQTGAKLKWQFDRMLWEQMLPALKLYSANQLFAAEMERQVGVENQLDENLLREQISVYVNDAFGGQEWEQYLWANPRTRKWLHMFMFAPDWTLSALNISGVSHIQPLQKALGSPTSEFHFRNRMTRYWGAFAGIVLLGIPNLLQALIYGLTQAFGDDEEKEKMSFTTFGNEVGHRLQVDFTPLMNMINDSIIGEGVEKITGLEDPFKYGKTKKRRLYLAWGKQAYEVYGKKGWLRDPVNTALGKSSIAVKLLMEQGFGIVKPGWQTPWAEHGFIESLADVDGNFWDGRLAGVVRKFIPMSLSPVIDGLSDPFKSKPIAFFAPTKLGTSAFAAKREIASVMKIYAEGGVKANFKGIVDNANLEDLVADIVDAAEKNGYNAKEVFSQGVSQARSFYYLKFFNAMQANDEDKMIEFANYLRRLETKKKNFAKSVERKLDTQGKKFDYASRKRFNDAWFGAYKKAAALEQAKRKRR